MYDDELYFSAEMGNTNVKETIKQMVHVLSASSPSRQTSFNNKKI